MVLWMLRESTILSSPVYQRYKEAFSRENGLGESINYSHLSGRISLSRPVYTAWEDTNWTLLYSLCCLKEFLPHRDCVKAYYLLCRRSITTNQLDDADTLLLDFCRKFEQLYGMEGCTINIHLHGHLKECVQDFGPVYAFWLFVSYIRRFVAYLDCNHSNWPDEYNRNFQP